MSRAVAHRELNRFEMRPLYDSGWKIIGYAVVARGFHTRLLTINKPLETDSRDFLAFAAAMARMCDLKAPAKRKRS